MSRRLAPVVGYGTAFSAIVACQAVLGIEDWTPKAAPDARGGAAGATEGGAGVPGAGGSAGTGGVGTGDAAPCTAEYCVTALATPGTCASTCRGSCDGDCSAVDESGACAGACDGKCQGTCVGPAASDCKGTIECGSAVAFGDPCSEAGKGACYTSNLPATCDGTRWTPVARCADGTRCDPTPGPGAGSCRNFVSECAGKVEGDRVCRALRPARCGPDLLTLELERACAVGGEVCVNGACQPCAARTGNCDSNATECETDLDDIATCGRTCGDRKVCSSSHGTAKCVAGVCGTSACETGYGDCGGTNDGCETDFRFAESCGTGCSDIVTCVWPTPACLSGVCRAPPSCNGLASDCGATTDESCCANGPVQGGTYFRSYDGVSVGYGDQSFPATVSNLLLDKFEVTVGRIRKFKAAWDAGFRPAHGAGKHGHLHGRQGLADVNVQSGAHEQGWDPAWSSNVALTDAAFGSCGYDTWTPAPAAQENKPINCVNWFEAYAFCIWDGGFLPSEAEWNLAAAAGNEQRVYPWSVPASSTTIDPTRAAYCGGSCSGPQVVGATPAGQGKYGQADLAGNVSEWILDANADYRVPCSDCAFLPPSPAGRVFRGGAFHNGALALRTAVTDYADPTTRIHYIGIRCARMP